jgi:hypothetical protein
VAPPTAAPAEGEPRPTFVFQGTVKRLRSTTMKEVSPDDRTFVVTVDHIVEAPAALGHLSGQDVTVRIDRGTPPRAGQQMLFHTNGWIFGDGIAVQSVRHEPVSRSHTALLTRPADPVEQKRQRDLRQRFDEAHVVVSGRVAEVRLPAEARARPVGRGRRAAAVEPPAHGPASEHDPHWREAVVEVDSVHKGSHGTREVVMRFAASTDVRWYKAPKFQPGQQGFFMLHRTPVSTYRARPAARRGRAAAAVAPAMQVTEDVYTALSPMDFQPYQQPGGIRTLIGPASSAPGQ